MTVARGGPLGKGLGRAPEKTWWSGLAAHPTWWSTGFEHLRFAPARHRALAFGLRLRGRHGRRASMAELTASAPANVLLRRAATRPRRFPGTWHCFLSLRRLSFARGPSEDLD